VHFNVPDADAPPLRVDIMSRMRGVAPFETLWERRTTVVLHDDTRSIDVDVELMALEDLVAAKKTQRDKDWPMLRRLVDASYDSARGSEATMPQIEFWLAELRSPEFLHDAVARFPHAAASSTRDAVRMALSSGEIRTALAAEQAHEMAQDRVYWEPLRRELETLRHQARRIL
jgi:phytoene dehydrogenase-like protein